MSTVEQRPLRSSYGVAPATQPEWIERLYTALNAHSRRIMAVQLGLYLAAAFSLAALKPFWFDELITFNIARQPSIHAIWQLLARGADPNPPLSHVLTFWSMRMFGHSEIAVRIPAICAGAITILCIYEFLVRRVPPIFAAIGVFFYLSTHAFDYAYEARSYSFLLCFAAVALLAWRWTHESRQKYLASALLTVALGLGLSSNYYGVLAFFPIAAGELVSSLQRRTVAWRVWLAMAAGATPLLAYLPLMRAAVTRFSPYAWNKPYSGFLVDAYAQMMDASVWLALGVIYSIVVVLTYERMQLGIRRTAILRLPESVAVTLLAAFPLLGYLMAVARGGMVSPRFVLPFCIGVSIVVAISGFKLIGRNQAAALFLLLSSFCWFAYRTGDIAGDYCNERQALDRIVAMLPTEGIIAVPDSLLATPLSYYAPPQVAKRVVFPMDLAAIRKYKREDSPEQNLLAAPEIYSLPLVPLEQLKAEHPNFFVLGPEYNWFVQKLYDDEAIVHRTTLDFRSHDLCAFTPLAHRDVYLYAVNISRPIGF